LKQKGRLAQGYDADLCVFEDDWTLSGVMGMGNWKYDPSGRFELGRTATPSKV
jgi:dihydroorotase-like cyclic amidohydrolase